MFVDIKTKRQSDPFACWSIQHATTRIRLFVGDYTDNGSGAATLGMTTLNLMTLSIMTLRIMTQRVTTLSMIALSITAPSIMVLIMTLIINDTQYK